MKKQVIIALMVLFFSIASSRAEVPGADSLIVALGLKTADVAALKSLPAFLASSETLLVVIPSNLARGIGQSGRIVAHKPPVPMWIVHGSGMSLRSQFDVEIYFAESSTWIVSAKEGTVRQMRQKGLIVSPVVWAPLDLLVKPTFGETLTRRLLAEKRPGWERIVRAKIASVDTARVAENLAFLCFDSSTQAYKTRYSCRTETFTEIVPFLTSLFSDYLDVPGWSVDTLQFEIPLCPQGTRLVDIVASRPGKRTSASYVICAHYDATAYRQADWNWETDPAPGSDDNASGVVGLLECARLLSDVDLDVGLRFIAFSGEEQGLLGSSYYVSQLSESDSIIAVINFDMLGYAQPSKSIEITYDWKSAWLASLLSTDIDTTLGLPIVTKNRTGIYNSDHASFWAHGIPGVMLNDRTEESGVPAYPYYHTTSDTIGNVDVGQVCDVIKLVTTFIGRFATALPETLTDIALSPSGIELDWTGRDWGDPIVEGTELRARIHATNIGNSMEAPQSYSLEIWEGERYSGKLVYVDTVEIFLAKGMNTDVEASWYLGQASYGDLTLTISLLPVGQAVESDLKNNETQVMVFVMPDHLVLDRLHIYPNPWTEGKNAKLAFEFLYREADPVAIIDISIFDITGKMVASGKLRLTNIYRDFEIGYNSDINIKDFLFSQDLAPGVYLLVARAKVIGESDRATAKVLFAVDR